MRNEMGMPPSIFGPGFGAESLSPAVAFASAGTYPTTMLAATLLPEVTRNLRRVGSSGCDWESSPDITAAFESKCWLKFRVLYDGRKEVSIRFLPKRMLKGAVQRGIVRRQVAILG